MSESQFEKDTLGPDFVGFYSHAVAQLLTGDEDVSGVAQRNNDETAGSTPSFSDVIGSQLSDLGKERLKGLVRQSLITLTREFDSILAAALGFCRVQSILKYKESLLKLPDATKDVDKEHNPQKKQKVLASVSMDDDLRLLLDGDSSKVEEMIKRHSAQLLARIEHMKSKVEQFIDLVLSNSRLMTLIEKQKLQKLIQNLPQRNLDRVVEIIRRDRPFTTEEIHVDLEEERNITLWRFYYYVQAVENARKLCEEQ